MAPDSQGGAVPVTPKEPELSLGMNLLYLEYGGHRILIDTGVGDDMTNIAPQSGLMLDNLWNAGIDPASIDLILLTHLHPDHCFGLTRKDNTIVFPNARLAMHPIEHAFWHGGGSESPKNVLASFTMETRRKIAPYSAQTVFIEDGADVVPGITPVLTPGHTMGHCIFIIKAGAKSIAYIGDLSHHFHYECLNPDWQLVYDADPVLAAASRRKFFGMLADGQFQVVATHFPFPAVGHIQRAGDVFAWQPSLFD